MIERRCSVFAEQGPRYMDAIRSGTTQLDESVADTLESNSAIQVAGQHPGLPNVIERAAILSTTASTSPRSDTKV
jgi:hypothetical protein